MTFQYHLVVSDVVDDYTIHKFNELGEQGWELAGWNNNRFIFKKGILTTAPVAGE